MFVRQQRVRKEGRDYCYLKVVENSWEAGRTVQRTILNLGNVVHWPAGRLTDLVRVLGRFVDADFAHLSDVRFSDCRQLGPFLPAQALWDELQIGSRVRGFLCMRRVDPRVAEYAKVLVFNRLVAPRSKLGVSEWLAGQACIPGIDPGELPLAGYYRTLEYLLSIKPGLEQVLFQRRCHLFNQEVSLVFYDLTSTYFEGRGCGRAAHGYSRDHRPDRLQIEIGLLVDDEGIPIGHEVFAGNRSDPTTVTDMLERLQNRFRIRRCIFVGDDAMNTESNIREVVRRQYEYITSLSLRSPGVGPELVAARPAVTTFRPVGENLWILELPERDGTRYVAAYNPERAQASRRHRRERLRRCLTWLRERQAPPKPNGRNRQPEKDLPLAVKLLQREHCQGLIEVWKEGGEPLQWRMNRAAWRQECRMDGLQILQTNSHTLTDEEVARGYRTLWRAEAAFRNLKDVLGLRPIRHWQDARVEGHVFICVLAYTLERLMDQALARAGLATTARMALEELKSIQVATLAVADRTIRRRSEISARQQELLRALGVGSVPELW
jgi:transposase